MAYPYDGMFYPTLPQDTQDFGQVLSGVGRSLREIGRSTQYLPYDVLGAPVDLATLALRPMGYTTERPVGGSDWLIELARQYGLADRPTGSGIETATRLATGITSPTAVPRAVGKFAQGLERASDITTEQANRAADALVRQITGNPTATAPQVLEATSMPFMQAVAPKAPSLLEAPVKSDLGFYSALEQATIPLQNKGTGSQFLAQIEKTAGVKPDEIKWTGLDEFLKSKPNVTKAEVQDYLAANRVNLQEVRLGGATSPYPYRTADEWQGAINRAEAAGNWDEAANLNQAWEAVEGFGPAGSPKFSQYTLPRGENYREILLTLPIQSKGASRYEVRPRKTPGESAVFDTETNKVIMFGRDAGMYQEADRLNRELAGTQLFRSTHFDQPNILAHMRVNDRVVDGKKTLFIEEIQSDWHQAGRKKGYMIPPKIELFQPQKLETSYDEFFGSGRVMADDQRLLGQINKQKNGKFKAEVVLEQNKAKDLGYFDSKEQAFDAIKNLKLYTHKKEGTMGFGEYSAFFLNEKDALASSKQSGVPDAPFKTTWHELSLKRAIQEASEKGYDQIAFTTGKTQAERYDLSKQIKTIVYGEPDEAGRRTVRAITPNGDQLLGGKYTMSEIEDNIGKEMAEKIQKSTGEFDQRTGTYAMSGLDLQVGGEGMKGFYDQILPKTLEKMGKKFDAKVGKTDMDGVEVWQMDITPKMRESVLTKGQPLFAATPALPALGLLGGEEE